MSKSPWWKSLDEALDGDTSGLEMLKTVGSYQRWLTELEGRAAALARRQGASWEDVGEALGVTRQSAWERFARQSVESAIDSPDQWVLAVPSGR